jgi:hypothetical protein
VNVENVELIVVCASVAAATKIYQGTFFIDGETVCATGGWCMSIDARF